jgi:hypothetical protein
VNPTPMVRLPRTAWAACCLALLLSVFFPASSPLQAQSKNFPADKRAQIEKAASSFMAANSVPGISVAFVQDGELVWSQGFGMADLENFVPATSSTLFRLGSISKPITATATGARRPPCPKENSKKLLGKQDHLWYSVFAFVALVSPLDV